MDTSVAVPALLLGLGVKCVFNWALVLVQRRHTWSSFVCVFGLSVCVVDTAAALCVAAFHLHPDTNVTGRRVTRHHACLLVQILGYTHSAQHSAVLVLATLEDLCAVLRPSQENPWKATWRFYLFLTLLVWICSTLYVFKLSDLTLHLDNTVQLQIDLCWISSSSVISEIAILTGFVLLCFILWNSLKCVAQLTKNPHWNYLKNTKNLIYTRFIFICKVARVFLETWALFLIFLFIHVVLPVEMPSYLGLNCGWLCFLNSLLIATALCAVGPRLEVTQGSAVIPPDSFCEWKRIFHSALFK